MRRRIASHPDRRFLGLVTVTYLFVLLAWVLVNPAYQGPDENTHFDLVVEVMGRADYPFDGSLQNREVLASRAKTDWSKEAVDRLASAAPPRGTRPPLSALPAGDTEFENTATQHPPGFYVVSGVWLTAIAWVSPLPFGVSHDLLLWFARLLNVLMIVPLPALAYLTASRLGLTRDQSRVAALLVLTVPQLAYIGASVNNDNMLVLGLSVATYLAARIATGDDRWSTSGWAGLAVGLACYAKVMGLLGFVMIGAAHGFVLLQRRDVATVRRGLFSLAVGLATGGWWFVRNVAILGKLQPTVREFEPRPVDPDVLVWGERYFRQLAQSFWGNFGYLDAPIPGRLVQVLTIAIGVLSVVAVVRTWRRPVVAVVAALPVLTIILANAWQHWTTIYLVRGTFNASQGRYLFGGVVAGVVLASAALGPRVARAAPALTLVVAFALHLVAAIVMGMNYWGLEDGVRTGVSAVLAWSPLANGVVLLSIAVLLASATALVLECLEPVRAGRRSESAVSAGAARP